MYQGAITKVETTVTVHPEAYTKNLYFIVDIFTCYARFIWLALIILPLSLHIENKCVDRTVDPLAGYMTAEYLNHMNL